MGTGDIEHAADDAWYGLWPDGDSSTFVSERLDGEDVIASISWYSDNLWYGYATGYADASKSLLAIIADSPYLAESLAFPIVYLARQAIELKLKETIRDLAKHRSTGAKPPSGHDLRKLWSRLREIMRQTWPNERSDQHEANLTALVEQWHAVDPASTTFRYPETKDGAPSLPFTDDHLNLTAAVKGAHRMLAFFDAVGLRAHEEALTRAEIAEAYADNYPSEH